MNPEVENNALVAALLVQCTAVLLLGNLLRRNRQRRRRRFGVHPINRRRNVAGHYNNLYLELREDHQKFLRYTRMTLDQFDHLLTLVTPHLPRRSTVRHRPMPPEMRLVITLRFLATGVDLMTLSTDYRIGESTCRGFIKETCQAIWTALQPTYLSPPTKEEYKSIAEDFWLRWNIPHCLGSIDGKHITIKCPYNTGSHYYNYKGRFSLILMAVCDARYCFSLVSIGHAGSASDGGIFRSCDFGNEIINNTLQTPEPAPLPGTVGADAKPAPFYFVGDEAFPLLNNLMTPYGKAQIQGRSMKTFLNRSFNLRLSRARRIVENSFGILAAKWRIFHREIEASPESVVGFVKACVVLHNYIIKSNPQNVPYNQHQMVDVYDDNDEFVIPGVWREEARGNRLQRVPVRGNRNAPESAKQYRDRLGVYFVWIKRLLWQNERVTRGTF